MTAKLFKRFGSDRSGNFALLSALLAVPLVMSAGVMIDLATINRTHSQLQQALDAAVLAVAREGDKISDSEARTIARKFIKGNLDAALAKLSVGRSGTAVTLDAKTIAPTAFGSLLGYDKWPVAAQSTADIAYASYEVALVLDTTGSMAGGKLSSLKDAVTGMIDDMSGQVKDTSKLKYALVPFATFVNVGSQYGPKFDDKGKMVKDSGAPWLDLKGKSDIPQLELKKGISRFEVYHNLGEDWKGCVETRMPTKKGANDVADTEPTKKDKESYFVPAFGIDEPSGWGYANDYIASPVDPLDKSKGAEKAKLGKYGIQEIASGLSDTISMSPVSIEHVGGKGPNRGCDTQPITPLTNDYNSLKLKVKSLEARGTTNIMEGVAWGNRVLSPGEPFTQGAKDKPGLEKIMIVLTDGANNLGPTSTKLGSEYSSFGYLVDGRLGITAGGASSTNAAMNDKTLAACQAAKDAGVEIYTIRLEEPDVKTGSMLKECASSPANFFDAPSRSQLDDVFKKIGENIVRLRISS